VRLDQDRDGLDQDRDGLDQDGDGLGQDGDGLGDAEGLRVAGTGTLRTWSAGGACTSTATPKS